MSVETFWSEKRWTLGFGKWGKDYSIVKAPQGGGYHVGLDAASDGDIPCLVAGRVVTVYKTGTMGYCVEVDTGPDRLGAGRFFTYCHVAGDQIPNVGDTLTVGARVGRTARGPKGIAFTSVDFPGTAWYGIHCHLVISDIRYAAWTIVKDRTLGAFYDPAPIIRAVLGGTPASGGAKPFDPEEDAMTEDDRKWLEAWFGIIRSLLQVPNQPYGWPQANSNKLDALATLVSEIQTRVRGSSPRGDMLQLIMEKLGQPIDVDEVAIAKTLAPLLTVNMAALSDDDVKRIAKAAADESDRRGLARAKITP